MHEILLLLFILFPSFLPQSFVRGRAFCRARECAARTLIFIKARSIYRWGSLVKFRHSNSDGGWWCSPLFNRDSTPSPPCRALAHIHICPPHGGSLSISRSYVSFRRLSEHRYALQGITRRTRVAVIYVACSLFPSLSRMHVRVKCTSVCQSELCTERAA